MAHGDHNFIGKSKAERMSEAPVSLSPWIYEFGNSLISSLAICLLVILLRFFAIEIYTSGWRRAYERARFKLGLSISVVMIGIAGYRSWMWWGRYCANTEASCSWMVRSFWPMVPALSIACEVCGILCMIRVLWPGALGRHAWMISALASLLWACFWFSGWDDVIGYLAVLF
jgi:divalent metal cation (Fe/Co/Zn/Cd) transporter